MNTWIQFGLLAGLLSMLPGLDTAQVLRASVRGGPKAAYLTLGGIMAGVWLWAIAAALGVSAVLLASPFAYAVVKYAGAAYLAYLGVRMLLASRKAHGLNLEAGADGTSAGSTFARALMLTLSNPKICAFYVAILPQFLPANINPILGAIALAGIHNACALIWYSVLIFATNLAKDFFARPVVTTWMERVSGVAMLGFGAKLALESA